MNKALWNFSIQFLCTEHWFVEHLNSFCPLQFQFSSAWIFLHFLWETEPWGTVFSLHTVHRLDAQWNSSMAPAENRKTNWKEQSTPCDLNVSPAGSIDRAGLTVLMCAVHCNLQHCSLKCLSFKSVRGKCMCYNINFHKIKPFFVFFKESIFSLTFYLLCQFLSKQNLLKFSPSIMESLFSSISMHHRNISPCILI